MAIINQSNVLNLQPGITAPVVVHMSEGDVGTRLSFKLIDGARAWTDPGNVVAAVHGTRQDGAQFGPYACTISGDVVSFQTTRAMSGKAGSGIAELVLTDGNGATAGSANFAVMVERASFPLGVTYDNDTSVYEAILGYVQTMPASIMADYNVKITEEVAERKAADAYLQSQINAEASERAQQDEVLSARMDEFAKLPDGSLSTAADAELADIRVTALGYSAPTAGDAVREQFEYLNERVLELLPNDTYSGTIIAEEFIGNYFNSIEIDTTDMAADLYICGKNIHPKYADGSASGLSWTVADDGTITFEGTPTADVLIRLQNLYYPPQTFAFAFFNNMAGSRLSFFAVNSKNIQNNQINLSTVNTIGSQAFTKNIVELRLRIPKDIDWTGLVIRPMMVVGSEAGEFEAYKGGKTAVTLTDGKVNGAFRSFDGINTIWSNKGSLTINATTEDLIKYISENLDQIKFAGGFYRFTQSGTSSYLNVYFQSGENFIGYELHNVPAPNSNSNTWQLGHTVAYKFDGTSLSDAVELIEGGEYELAMRENGAADYCGGNNHGDENTVVFKLFIDGEQVTDLAAFATGEFKTFDRIDAFDISLVDRCDTPGDNIARHQKHWTFEGGKVEVQQTLKFLQDLRLDVVLLCMCCAKRTQFPYGIRQGAVDIEDMSVGGFPHITTRGNDASYFYFGNNATINIKAKTDSPTQSALYINSTATQNKLYYGYYQATNSANPTEVTAGTIIQETSLYDVAYN